MEWRHHFRTTRVRLLWISVIALLLFGALQYWPSTIRVDFLRHTIAEELREITGRQISLGHIYVRLLPRPGLTATDFMIMDAHRTKQPVLRVAQISLSIYVRPLFSRQLRIRHITLNAAHFFVRRHRNTGSAGWGVLDVPPMPLFSGGAFAVETISAHQGQVDWIDETFSRPLRLTFKPVTLRINLITGRGDLEASDRALGKHTLLRVTYERETLSPVHVLLNGFSPTVFRAYFPTASRWLQGSLDLDARGYAAARGSRVDQWAIDLTHGHTDVLPGIALRAHVTLSTAAFQLAFQTGGASPETVVTLHSAWPRHAVTVHAALSGLSPQVASLLGFSPWASRLRGPGHLAGSASYIPGTPLHRWQASGSGFTLAGSSLRVQQLHCIQDPSEMSVQVEALAQAGTASVKWSRASGSSTADLQVQVSSVSVGEVLDALAIVRPPPEPPGYEPQARHFLRRGFETLVLQSGALKGVLVASKRLEMERLDVTAEGGMLHGSGLIDWQESPGRWAVQGSYRGWSAEPLLRHFLTGPPVLEGAGDCQFNLQSTIGSAAVSHLGGTLILHLTNGTLFELKNIYRIASLVDLSNYFKLRAPDVAARGVPYSELDGSFAFTQGLMESNDVFLSAPDTKMSARGTIDWPAARLDATVEFQPLRFVEDILRNVPGLRWIFRNGRKIILPLAVRITGPFSHVSIY